MKKRLLEEFKEENEKSKSPKMKAENMIDQLPKVLIKYLSHFFDFDTMLAFSSTNRKHRNTLLEIIKGYSYLNVIDFISEYSENKKEFVKQKLMEKDLSSLIIPKENSDFRNENPLHFACQDQNISLEMLRFLVEYKCDLNLKNYRHEIPIHKAIKNEKISFEIIKYLVENKSNINSKGNNGNFLLHKMKFNNSFKKEQFSIEILNYLMEKKCKFDCSNNLNENPLHFECKVENISFEIIKILVENKSNINQKDINYNSPLHLACENNFVSLEIIQYLVEKKSDVNQENFFQKTPYKSALNNISIIRSIKKKFGKEVDIQKILKNIFK